MEEAFVDLSGVELVIAEDTKEANKVFDWNI